MSADVSLPHSSPDLAIARTTDDTAGAGDALAAKSNVPESKATSGRKQSKSRNGCATCKAKRLKCDETKPFCLQCKKRGAQCAGYKKDFKWKPFGEASFVHKTPATKHRKTSSAASAHLRESLDEHAESLGAGSVAVPRSTFGRHDSLVGNGVLDERRQSADVSVQIQAISPELYISSLEPQDIGRPDPQSFITPPPDHNLSAQLPQWTYKETTFVGSGSQDTADDIEDLPRPLDLRTKSPAFGKPLSMLMPASPSYSSDSLSGPWTSSPLPRKLMKERHYSMGPSEKFAVRFENYTCTILSIKNGPSENPWRTLVWPLAQTCKPLYHAIAALTDFHDSADNRTVVRGLTHVQKCLQLLNAKGVLQRMMPDEILATSLALAFSDSWAMHIVTGVNHIQGVKGILLDAVRRHKLVPYPQEVVTRLNFLSKTWVYADVISRLSSFDDGTGNDIEAESDKDSDTDFEAIAAGFAPATISGTTPPAYEVDPLMGCGAALFPLVRRVANLAGIVLRSSPSCPIVLSRALALQAALTTWTPPSFILDPEDGNLTTDHALHTAEAYRHAALLYLHQTVPSICPTSSTTPTSDSIGSTINAKTASLILTHLAAVPMSSGAVIVQIFPLTTAGCEAVSAQDRKWVSARLDAMAGRLAIGVMDRCKDIVLEVWKRRDAYGERKARRAASPATTGRNAEVGGDEGACGDHDEEEHATVRGSLHWSSVMRDWRWEVLMG